MLLYLLLSLLKIGIHRLRIHALSLANTFENFGRAEKSIFQNWTNIISEFLHVSRYELSVLINVINISINNSNN